MAEDGAARPSSSASVCSASGGVLASANRGETWDLVSFTFPRIGAVHAFTA